MTVDDDEGRPVPNEPQPVAPRQNLRVYLLRQWVAVCLWNQRTAEARLVRAYDRLVDAEARR